MPALLPTPPFSPCCTGLARVNKATVTLAYMPAYRRQQQQWHCIDGHLARVQQAEGTDKGQIPQALNLKKKLVPDELTAKHRFGFGFDSLPQL